jgi:predicted RNA binding protein YcfA (HicA-like mRNA interferase family)
MRKRPLAPSLRTIRQEDAVKALVRLGGEERRGKGSHRVVNMNGYNLSVPAGILKIGLLKRLIKLSGRTEIEFLENV